jgi:hypothetical protein
MNTQNIAGVPSHVKVVAFGKPKYGEYFINSFLPPFVEQYDGGQIAHYPIVEANNVYLTTDLSTVKIPAGYELAGKTQDEWFREPKDLEVFIPRKDLGDGPEISTFFVCLGELANGDKRRLILRPIAPKTKKVLIVETDAPDVIKYFEKGCDLTLSAPAACAFAGVKNARVEVREVK